MSQNPESQRSDPKPAAKLSGKPQSELSKEQLDRVAGGVGTSDISITKQTNTASPKL